MKILRKNFFITFILLIFLNSCGSWESVKRGMTNQKQKTTDEFLVKKKDPLIFPPEFEKLPMPEEYSVAQEDEELEFEKLILGETQSSMETEVSKGSSIENSVLKKIREN